jgi:hypothetical protein
MYGSATLPFVIRSEAEGSAVFLITHRLSSRPERTRISYIAVLETNTYATLRKERRMNFINATALNGKSGGAQWRDLLF